MPPAALFDEVAWPPHMRSSRPMKTRLSDTDPEAGMKRSHPHNALPWLQHWYAAGLCHPGPRPASRTPADLGP